MAEDQVLQYGGQRALQENVKQLQCDLTHLERGWQEQRGMGEEGRGDRREERREKEERNMITRKKYQFHSPTTSPRHLDGLFFE